MIDECRDRRRGAVPREFLAGGPLLRHQGLSPARDSPTSSPARRIEWPKGALEQSLDLVLPRGVVIHGKVTEEGSGKPVAGAMVNFCHSRGAARTGTSESIARPYRIRWLVPDSGPRPARVTSSSGPRRRLRVPDHQLSDDRAGPAGRPAGSTRMPTPCST